MKKLFVTSLILLCSGPALQAQTAYAPFYDAPKESYVKSMKSVFKDLYYRKWENAKKDYDKVVEKSDAAKAKAPASSNTQLQALFPLPQVAQSIMLSTENSMVPDWTVNYVKAYSLLKCALTYPEKEKLNSFLSDPDVNVNLNMLEDKIEGKLCSDATKANTEQAYDAVIDSLLPQSLHYQNMKSQREELVFKTISQKPTEAECTRFLTKYTDAMPSKRVAISHSLDSLRYFSFAPTIENLRNYIKQYPESSYTHEATDTLETLEFLKVDSTAAACRQFMERYPSSKYVMTIKKQLEKYAYSEAMHDRTATAYLNFCKEFPYDLRYQTLFDSLLTKTVTTAYDSVFAGKQPNQKELLSKTFYENILRCDTAYQQMIEKSLVPPRRKCIWYGTTASIDSKPFNHLNITSIDLKSKILAVVQIHLTGEKTQTDAELYFIFENNALKIDDIRFADGSSMKQNP